MWLLLDSRVPVAGLRGMRSARSSSGQPSSLYNSQFWELMDLMVPELLSREDHLTTCLLHSMYRGILVNISLTGSLRVFEILKLESLS